MGNSLDSAKDTVRKRSGGCCEKCGVELTRNIHGIPDGDTACSIHHRQPRRWGGRDSVICMVNLCIKCHKEIHEDEEVAQQDGWIVTRDQFPGHIPFLSWKGWVLPALDGSLTPLDFDRGRAGERVPAPTTRRRRVATRTRQGHRKSRKSVRAA